MCASSTKAGVVWLVQMISLVVMTGCGGGGGGDALIGPASVTETFLLKYAVRTDCPPSSGSLLTSPAATARVLAPCVDAATVVTADGQPFDAASIPDGSVAVVRGSRTLNINPLRNPPETSVATAIDIQRTVVGTIESVDFAHVRFSVLGQQIYVSDITRIAGNGTTDTLAVGDRVAVSGFFSPTGEVVATAISFDAGGQGFVLRGILNAHAGGGFQIGRMVLELSDAAFEGFPGGAPADGDAVVVFAGASPSGDVLAADSVRFIGGAWGEAPEDIRSFVGMVSSRPSPSEMDVEGRVVDCAFFHCEEAREAQIGTLVSVVQGDRYAEARNRVEILEPASRNILVVGPVGDVDALNGSLSVLGFPIQALPGTVMNDQAEQPIRVGDIEIGDMVAVDGGPVGRLLVAGRIRPSSEPNLQIWTRVATYADPEIHVLGRTILTNGTTVVFEDCGGERDQVWLFRVAAASWIVQLRMEVSLGSGGEFSATRVDVDTDACNRFG